MDGGKTSQRVLDALGEARVYAGFATNARDMYVASAHVQAYATLHAADLLTKAIDRNTAALKALTKSNSV
jgi:hypothetical protein